MHAHHRLERLQRLDRCRRVATLAMWCVAALLVAIAGAQIDWRAAASAGVGIAGVATVQAWRRALTVRMLAASADAHTGDGLVATACSVERGDHTGDDSLGSSVVSLATARLDQQGTACVPTMTWPWGAGWLGVAAVAWLFIGPTTSGSARQAAGQAPNGATPGPISGQVHALTTAMAETRWAPRAVLGNAARNLENGAAEAAVDREGLASTAGEGTGTPSAAEAMVGAGQEGGCQGLAGAEPAGPSSGDARARAEPLGGERNSGSTRRNIAFDPGSANARPELPDLDHDVFTTAGLGTSPDDEGSQMPRGAEDGTSSGRMADQTEDLDFDVEHAGAGEAKEGAVRETNSGRAGAMGSNDAPGTDDTEQQAIAEAELAEEWVEARLRNSPVGGLHVRAALEEGLGALRRAETPLRHLVLFADASDVDGRTGGFGGHPLDVVRLLARDDVTVSVIAVGPGGTADLKVLQQLALEGGGRFAHSDDYRDLAALFVAETEQMVGQGVEDTDITVVPGRYHPGLRGVDLASAPALLGRNRVEERSGTRVWATTEAGEPLLASWRVGLGEVVAVGTDLGGGWGRPWARWSGGPRLWTQTVRHVSRRRDGSGPVSVRIADGTVSVSVAQDTPAIQPQLAWSSGTASGEGTLELVALGLWQGRSPVAPG